MDLGAWCLQGGAGVSGDLDAQRIRHMAVPHAVASLRLLTALREVCSAPVGAQLALLGSEFALLLVHYVVHLVTVASAWIWCAFVQFFVQRYAIASGSQERSAIACAR